jgi:hypothetical protein
VIPEINIDDTSDCPVAAGCESCGSKDGLAIVTLDSTMGVFCVTICPSCAEDPHYIPSISPNVAVVRVGRHCDHVGIDLDQAAVLHATQRAEDRASGGPEPVTDSV